jgi:hypothetical protein
VAVVFSAKVHASTTTRHAPKATGTVTFAVTGSHGVAAGCQGSDVRPLSPSETATCRVPPAELQAVDSPYSVTATYSGDATFATSTSTALSETVTTARTHMALKFAAKPASDTASVFTASVVDGADTPLVSGSVLFAVSSTKHRGPKAPRCAGGNLQPLTGDVATCTLPVGWFVVPKATKADAHPRGSWDVTAVYDPDSIDFRTSQAARSGSAG